MITVCVTDGGTVNVNVVVVLGVGMLRHEQTLEEYGADRVAGIQPLACRGTKIRFQAGLVASYSTDGVSCIMFCHIA